MNIDSKYWPCGLHFDFEIKLLPAKRFVDALLITCSFANNVELKCAIFLCDNIYCLQKKTKLLNKRESTSTQLLYEKRIIYFYWHLVFIFNMWPVYVLVMLSFPLFNWQSFIFYVPSAFTSLIHLICTGNKSIPSIPLWKLLTHSARVVLKNRQIDGLSHRAWLRCSVQESWWKLFYSWMLEKCFWMLSTDRQSLIWVNTVLVCTWKSLTKWSSVLSVVGWETTPLCPDPNEHDCWNNQSECFEFSFTELFSCTTTILFLLMQKRQEKIKLNCCWLCLWPPPPIFFFDSGKFKWGVIRLKKGGKKFSGKLQTEKTLHDDKLIQLK